MNEKLAPSRRQVLVPLVILAFFIATIWVILVLPGLQSHEQPHHEQPLLKEKPTSHFHLKHIFHHGTGEYSRVHRRLDITPSYIARNSETLRAPPDLKRSLLTKRQPNPQSEEHSLQQVVNEWDWPRAMSHRNPWTIELAVKERETRAKVTRLAERHTPHFLDSYLEYAMRVKGNPAKLNAIALEWEPETEIRVPDVRDRDTVVLMALVSSNAYVRLPRNDNDKQKLDWIDVGDPWAPDDTHNDVNFGWLENGLRGHVFVSNDLKTVIIGIKGTSGAGLPGGGLDETAGQDKTNDNLLFLCCCARVSYLWTTVCDCYEKTYTCNQDCLERELLRQDRYYQAALDLYRNVTALYPPETTDIWVTGHSLGGALALLLGRTFGLPVVAFEAPGEMLATKRLHLPQAPGIPKHMEHIWHFGNTADPIFMGVCNGASSSCSVAGYAMETTCHTGQICVYDVVSDKGWHVNLLNHRIHTVIDDIILAYNETAECVDQPPCRDCFNWRFTSHDDSEPDAPQVPAPLRPRPTSSSSLLSTLALSTRRSSASTISLSSRYSKSTSTSSSTSSSSSSSSSSSTTSHKSTRRRLPLTTTSPTSLLPEPTESEPPKKCLERTWYGWCTKWGTDDDEPSSR